MSLSVFAIADSEITAWVAEHVLRLSTEHWDHEVRSVDVERGCGRRPFQIWVDPPQKDGTISVHAWDRKRLRLSRRVHMSEVRAALDEALAWVRSHA